MFLVLSLLLLKPGFSFVVTPKARVSALLSPLRVSSYENVAEIPTSDLSVCLPDANYPFWKKNDYISCDRSTGWMTNKAKEAYPKADIEAGDIYYSKMWELSDPISTDGHTDTPISNIWAVTKELPTEDSNAVPTSSTADATFPILMLACSPKRLGPAWTAAKVSQWLDDLDVEAGNVFQVSSNVGSFDSVRGFPDGGLFDSSVATTTSSFDPYSKEWVAANTSSIKATTTSYKSDSATVSMDKTSTISYVTMSDDAVTLLPTGQTFSLRVRKLNSPIEALYNGETLNFGYILQYVSYTGSASDDTFVESTRVFMVDFGTENPDETMTGVKAYKLLGIGDPGAVEFTSAWRMDDSIVTAAALEGTEAMAAAAKADPDIVVYDTDTTGLGMTCNALKSLYLNAVNDNDNVKVNEITTFYSERIKELKMMSVVNATQKADIDSAISSVVSNARSKASEVASFLESRADSGLSADVGSIVSGLGRAVSIVAPEIGIPMEIVGDVDMLVSYSFEEAYNCELDSTQKANLDYIYNINGKILDYDELANIKKWQDYVSGSYTFANDNGFSSNDNLRAAVMAVYGYLNATTGEEPTATQLRDKIHEVGADLTFSKSQEVIDDVGELYNQVADTDTSGDVVELNQMGNFVDGWDEAGVGLALTIVSGLTAWDISRYSKLRKSMNSQVENSASQTSSWQNFKNEWSEATWKGKAGTIGKGVAAVAQIVQGIWGVYNEAKAISDARQVGRDLTSAIDTQESIARDFYNEVLNMGDDLST